MIKAVFKFSGPGGSQWTEILYTSGTFTPQNDPIPVSVRIARLAFLDDQSMLRSIRYSNPDARDRASAIQEYNVAGTYNGGTEQAAIPEVSLVYTMSSVTPLGNRKIHFHGLNELQYDVNIQTGNVAVKQAVKDLVNQFMSEYVNSGGVIRLLTRNVTIGSGLSHVTSVKEDLDNPQNSIVTTKENHGIVLGDMVRIRGASKKSAPGLNGTYMALAFTAKTITINYTAPSDVTLFSGGCFLRLNTYVANAAVANWSYHSVVGRKVKGSFFGSRGARSGNKLRHSA